MGLNSFAEGEGGGLSSSKSVVIRCIFSVFIGMLVFVAAPKASASGVISPFAFATPLTGVSIVPNVHHEEDHNACKVDAIVAYDLRIDLMWVNKDNACFTKL